MSPARLWRLLLASMLAVFVVACKPHASFTVTPEPVIAGQVATFDASGTLVAPTPRNNDAAIWQWDFGDGSTGTGRIATHTYATAGTYEVKLTVKDKAGREGVANIALLVSKAPQPDTVPVTINVRGADNTDLAGAQVALGSSSGLTDTHGQVILSVKPGQPQVLTVSHRGFITQVLNIATGFTSPTASVLATLTPIKETMVIEAIDKQQWVAAASLNTSIRLPANALVRADTGTPATGPAMVEFTPWDVRSQDLYALPGNGLLEGTALTKARLLAAGVVTVNIHDTAGHRLELAPGKTAELRMDMPFSSFNGSTRSVGSEISLWRFDTVQGVWTTAGTGRIEASSSASGMSLAANITQLATWSWGDALQLPGSALVRCVETNGAKVPCNVIAEATLDGGGRWSYVAGTEAADLEMQLPATSVLRWTAFTADGRTGTVTASNSAPVEIQVSSPAYRHFVRCQLPDGVFAACVVDLTGLNLDGSMLSARYRVPAEGATIRTLNTVQADLLSWTGASEPQIQPSGKPVLMTGSTSLTASADIVLALGTEADIRTKTVRLQCAPTITGNPDATLSRCNLDTLLFLEPGGLPIQQDRLLSRKFVGLPTAIDLVLNLSTYNGQARLQLIARGVTEAPLSQNVVGRGTSWEFTDILDQQLFSIQLFGPLTP